MAEESLVKPKFIALLATEFMQMCYSNYHFFRKFIKIRVDMFIGKQEMRKRSQ